MLEKLLRNPKLVIAAVALIMLVIWVSALWPRQPTLTVTVLSVGQGDSIVIRTPKGHVILVDCGPDTGSRSVTSFLRRNGVNSLDAMIITHPHADHIGGAESVLSNFRVKDYMDAGSPHPTGDYIGVLKEIERQRIPYRKIGRGQVIDFHDGVKIEVISPAANASDSDLNDSSAVLRVCFGRTRVLLAGDADQPAEKAILESGTDVSADILKVGHHGSSKASSREWLAAVNPKAAVISVGYRNPFYHPSPEALRRLRDIGAKVFRTDLDGGVTITSDGSRTHIVTTRERD